MIVGYRIYSNKRRPRLSAALEQALRSQCGAYPFNLKTTIKKVKNRTGNAFLQERVVVEGKHQM